MNKKGASQKAMVVWIVFIAVAAEDFPLIVADVVVGPIPHAAEKPGSGGVDFVPPGVQLKKHVLHDFFGQNSATDQRKREAQQSTLLGVKQSPYGDIVHTLRTRLVDSGSRFQHGLCSLRPVVPA